MIKVFQLKAARSVIGLGVREIGTSIGLSRSTISRLEHQDNHSYIDFFTDTQTKLLIFCFKKCGIIFPNDYTITLRADTNSVLDTSDITRFQLRAGRAILGLTQCELAEQLNLKKIDLNYVENLDNFISIFSTSKIFDKDYIINYFVEQGITFINKFSVHFN